MANVNAPNGFQFFGKMEGASPTIGKTIRKIASNNNTPIGFGDPVVSLVTGYIARAAAGTTQIAGIFFGCRYLATNIGRVIWSRSWPGSGATGDIEAYIDSDPNSLFVAQSNGSPITFADINANIQPSIGTPASELAGGFSTSSLDQSTLDTTATDMFRIVGLLSDYHPAGSVNGTDNSSNFNRVIVRVNYSDRTSTLGMNA